MAARIVTGLFQSEGIAEDACHRLKTEGVPAADIGRKVVKEIGRPPETMEPELEAGFLGPLILGNFRETFAPYIRNGETPVCVQAATDEQVEMAIDVLKLYTPIEVRIFRRRKVLIREPYNEIEPRKLRCGGSSPVYGGRHPWRSRGLIADGATARGK